MLYPQVEIKPEESLQEAEAKVESAYEALGGVLLAFDNLNSFLPISSYCHFFQVHVGGRELVLVVMAAEWDEKTLLTVLNVLLEIRTDPDPPGQLPLFRFYSPYATPPVLTTLFGDSVVSDFECRAALVAHFGKDLLPARALQFAAAGFHLLRECVDVRTDFFDEAGESKVGEAVVDILRAENLPDDGAPLNSLICLGFLYGEMLRGRTRYPSRWVRMRDPGPWPVIVFGPSQNGSDTVAEAASGERPDPAPTKKGTPQVVFNPIGIAISLYQDENEAATFLEASSTSLAERLKEELEAPRLAP